MAPQIVATSGGKPGTVFRRWELCSLLPCPPAALRPRTGFRLPCRLRVPVTPGRQALQPRGWAQTPALAPGALATPPTWLQFVLLPSEGLDSISARVLGC